MANITAIAERFFEACETGKGWEGCQAYCTGDASFAAQSEPLANVKTLREYCDWMKGLLTFMPDGRYTEIGRASCRERVYGWGGAACVEGQRGSAVVGWF